VTDNNENWILYILAVVQPIRIVPSHVMIPY
jgi:hypothetical protein